jgi:hypothetical protein
VGTVHLFSAQVIFGVEPECARTEGAQARAFQSVGVVNRPFAVEQDCEGDAGFFQPLLDGGQGAEGDDEDPGVEFGKFFLTGAQLCDMLTAGYSAQMTQENQQGVVAVFEHFAKADLLAGGGVQGEGGGGGVGFHVEC